MQFEEDASHQVGAVASAIADVRRRRDEWDQMSKRVYEALERIAAVLNEAGRGERKVTLTPGGTKGSGRTYTIAFERTPTGLGDVVEDGAALIIAPTLSGKIRFAYQPARLHDVHEPAPTPREDVLGAYEPLAVTADRCWEMIAEFAERARTEHWSLADDAD